MARIKRVAAMLAVLALPVIAAFVVLTFVPGAPPPTVPVVVRIGESLQPTTSRTTPPPATSAPPTSSTPSPTPLPPPPPIGDDSDDGDDSDNDGGGDDDG
jgi:hypothetical protein